MLIVALLLVAGASAVEHCHGPLAQSQPFDPLALWRAYAAAGFSPENSFFDVDENGYYLYVPGAHLKVPSATHIPKKSKPSKSKRSKTFKRLSRFRSPLKFDEWLMREYHKRRARTVHKYYHPFTDIPFT